jgi:Cu(I)-responsive transcriptional regulator
MTTLAALDRADALEHGFTDIGGASRASGVSVKMIRHYEAIGLLPKVVRSSANYRLYRESDVHTLRFIRRSRTLGFSMKQIQELVGLWQNKSRSSAVVKKIAGKHADALKTKIAELNAMVRTLEHLSRHCHGDHRPDCPILDDLAERA